MAICNNCGNNDKSCLQIIYNNKKYHFDCFQCAIFLLAPCCQSCGLQIIGHALDISESEFCCNHCLKISLNNANAKLPLAGGINDPTQ